MIKLKKIGAFMKTKTYYDDSLKDTLKAKVISSSEENGKYWLELNETIFFPEGGGMIRDKGNINGHELLDLKWDNKKVLHLIDTNLEGEVVLQLDKKDRLRRMQCHSSQHLIGALFMKYYHIAGALSHHYLTDGTCDLELEVKDISNEELRKIEQEANEIISQDLPYEISYVSKEEAQKYTNDFDEYKDLDVFRLVTIPGVDINLCGCPHVPSSGYLKGIIITSLHRVQDHIKIELMCGDLLVEKAHQYFDELTYITNLLASKIDNANEAVDNLMNLFKKTNNKFNNYKTKYLELYSNNIIKDLDTSKVNFIYESHNDLEMADLQYLVSKFSIIDKVIIAGVLKKADGTSNLMIAKNPKVDNFSAKVAFKSISEKYAYRGGGNDIIAQGGGKTFDQMDEIIQDTIKNLIK